MTANVPPPGSANGTSAPVDTPSQRAADSDTATCDNPAGQAPCANSATRCGSVTANGTIASPDDVPGAVAFGSGVRTGIDPCST
ncbi:hypothetical protein [Kitasatospora griseola]|uniref:hypothetical protein n=1 Tax=Kitasatospora griseola TaxID=2064 RepID=UPI0036534EB8